MGTRLQAMNQAFSEAMAFFAKDAPKYGGPSGDYDKRKKDHDKEQTRHFLVITNEVAASLASIADSLEEIAARGRM